MSAIYKLRKMSVNIVPRTDKSRPSINMLGDIITKSLIPTTLVNKYTRESPDAELARTRNYLQELLLKDRE